jgi:hypothetical protein
MKLLGSNPRARVEGVEPLPGRVNYLKGKDPKRWRAGIPTYRRVRCGRVYPGVDLVYYGSQGRMEYDFVLQPGADPGQIRLAYGGADKVTLDAAGDLVLHAPGGELRQHKPVVYQEVDGQRVPIAGEYLFASDEPSAKRQAPSAEAPNASPTPTHPYTHTPIQVSFRVAEYDRSKPLVIDPVLSYSSYLGGAGIDSGSAIAVDGSGNAYVTGTTRSADFPATSGAFDTTQNDQALDSFDVFVTKLNAAGTDALFSTYLGGADRDFGNDLAVDSNGNVYVAGATRSADFPTTAGAFDTTRNTVTTAYDGFVAKLSAAGSSLTYSTFLGGDELGGADAANGIAVDGSGAVYVTGAITASDPAVADAFVKKLDTNGASLAYTRMLSGTGNDGGKRIAADGNGGVAIAGDTQSNDFPATAGAFQTTFGGGSALPGGAFRPDAFVARLDASGAVVYATYLGGTDSDTAGDVAINSSGEVYVTGTTVSANFPTVAGAPDTALSGNEAFVARLNSNGSGLVYSTFLGGGSDDGGNGIALDSAGAAYVTGFTRSTDFPVTTDAFQSGRADASSGSDAFVAKLNAGGTALAYASYLGGTGDDTGNDVAVDADGNAYVTGSTTATNFPTTPSAFQIVGTSTGNGWVAKITAGTPLVAPAAPSKLVAQQGAAGKVDLTWQDNSTDETGFEVVYFVDATWSRRGVAGADSTTFQDSNLQAGKTYTYRVRAVKDGIASPWSNDATTGSSNAPPPPSDLTVLGTLPTAIRLGWTDNSSNETGFKVERKTGNGTYTTTFTTAANVTQFDDTTVAPGLTYTYRVRAFNGGGDSAPSNEVTVTVPQTPPPTAPSNLVVTGVSRTSVDLSWRDNSNNETGFSIERRTGTDPFVEIGTVAVNVTVYHDTASLQPGVTYNYRVRATSGRGSSGASNPVTVKVPLAPPPAAPGNLELKEVNGTSVRLVWRDRSGDETGFRIERAIGDGPFTALTTVRSNGTSYINEGLEPGVRYVYQVRAINLNGESDPSNKVEVTIPAVLAQLQVSPASVRGSRSVQGIVTILGAAPAEGLAVTLSSNNTRAVSMPRQVVIQPGRTSALFTVRTRKVRRNVAVTLTGQAGGVIRTARLTVRKR